MRSYHLTQEQALELASNLELAGLDITVWTSGCVTFDTKAALQDFANAVLDQILGKQWISVEDRLPQDETPVLAIYRQTEYIVAELRWEHPSFEDTYKAFRYWDSPYDDGQAWEWQDITHWMPIPSAPKESVLGSLEQQPDGSVHFEEYKP